VTGAFDQVHLEIRLKRSEQIDALLDVG